MNYGICAACAHYGDYSSKPVEYCSSCDAYLCAQHQGVNWQRFVTAFSTGISSLGAKIKELLRL